MSGTDNAAERAVIKRLARDGFSAVRPVAHAIGTITRNIHQNRINPSGNEFRSPVEEAVLEREAASLLNGPELTKQPDPRLKVLENAIDDPQIRRALSLHLNLIDGRERSLPEIADEMKISKDEARNAIIQGTAILAHKKP